jgi:hypothetical protein
MSSFAFALNPYAAHPMLAKRLRAVMMIEGRLHSLCPPLFVT